MISKHEKYGPSLEMQIFMAENPDMNQPSFDFKPEPYNLYDPAFAFANTSDTNDLNKILAPNYFASQNYSKPQREPRFSRAAADYNFDDFNDRESEFRPVQ